MLSAEAQQAESYEHEGQEAMSDFQNAVIKLMSSPHYKKLAAYRPPFNPFEIVGATHLELIHSSVLAWLLKDEANKEFRQRFVTWIIDMVVAEAEKTEDLIKSQELRGGSVMPENPENPSIKAKKTKEELIELQKLWDGLDVPEKPIVGTEEGDKASRYDVSVHFESLEFVIGIEVKVWAKEEPKQVERYQKLLCRNHPDYKKAVVFLTPEGRESRTADKSKVDVPVLAMSWGCISEIIREMQLVLGDENKGDKSKFRMQFLQHLDRNIAMNETKEQRIVRELLSEGDNLEIINEITREMKTWDDKEAIEGKLNDKDSVEMVQKIIDNRSSLQTSLECEFWKEFGKQLRDQPQLRDEELEFQLYKSDDLESEVIESERLKEYIKWGYDGWLGLTFSIPSSSLNQDDDHEVACRITYNPVSISHVFYGFVLSKKDNIRNRVEIDDKNHKEYLELYGELKGEILEHGPDEDGKHGWLGWNNGLKKVVGIYFANKPVLFDTLVKIKEQKRKKNVVEALVKEICDVVEKISKETEKRRTALTPEKSGNGQNPS